MIRAAIFDLDGVIVDTSQLHYLAWKSIAEDLGIPFTTEDNERLKGVSRMASLEILLHLDASRAALSEEDKQELAARKNDIYRHSIGLLGPEDLLPGAREFILECRSSGLKTAVASASRNTPSVIAFLEVAELFDSVVDGNRVHRAKPDPEVFLTAADDLAVPASNCVVFEDAAAGIDGALAAGMFCVGIGSEDTLGAAHLVIPGFDGFSLDDLFRAPGFLSANAPQSINGGLHQC